MRRTNIYFVPRNVGGNLVLNTLVLENLLKSLLIFSLERAGYLETLTVTKIYYKLYYIIPLIPPDHLGPDLQQGYFQNPVELPKSPTSTTLAVPLRMLPGRCCSSRDLGSHQLNVELVVKRVVLPRPPGPAPRQLPLQDFSRKCPGE